MFINNQSHLMAQKATFSIYEISPARAFWKSRPHN